MITQILFFSAVVGIAYLNYRLTKAYWCHEGMWGEDIREQ